MRMAWGAWGCRGSEDLAEEVPGPLVPWCAEDLGGRPLLDDPAAVDEDDPVGDFAGEADLVGDDDERGAAGGQVLDDGEDFTHQFGIEGGGGLVEEDDAGTQGDGAGDGDTLLLSTGELAGVAPVLSARPTRPRSSRASSCASDLPSRPVAIGAAATLSSTVRCGNRLKFWKTKPIRPR